MKKVIIILSFVAGLSVFMTGCSDYLDSDYLFEERMSIEDVFSNKDYTNRWLAEGYAYLGNNYMQDVCSKKILPFNFADDMYFGDEGDGYKAWKSGQYSEKGVLGNNNQSLGVWETAYKGIRQVSIFLNNIIRIRNLQKKKSRILKVRLISCVLISIGLCSVYMVRFLFFQRKDLITWKVMMIWLIQEIHMTNV